MFQTHRIVHPPKIKTLAFLFIATVGIASAAQSDAPASSLSSLMRGERNGIGAGGKNRCLQRCKSVSCPLRLLANV